MSVTGSASVGLTGFGDYNAGPGPRSVAVLRQHFLGNSGTQPRGRQGRQPVYYGSGAKSSPQQKRYDTSREARRPQTDPPVRGIPAGPVEQLEWMDALEEVKTRVSTLERLQRTQAQHNS